MKIATAQMGAFSFGSMSAFTNEIAASDPCRSVNSAGAIRKPVIKKGNIAVSAMALFTLRGAPTKPRNVINGIVAMITPLRWRRMNRPSRDSLRRLLRRVMLMARPSTFSSARIPCPFDIRTMNSTASETMSSMSITRNHVRFRSSKPMRTARSSEVATLSSADCSMRRLSMMTLRRFCAVVALFACACRRAEVAAPHPSILLVTLDTTRADAIGPDAKGVRTPSYNALVPRGWRFLWAYTPVPQTLPAHTSMLTGLYPAGHGVHENSRQLGDDRPLVSERLRSVGYRTAAFVSAFAVARRFGLARGFDAYDDDFGGERAERPAGETTDRAIAFLNQRCGTGEGACPPLFLWVHYYDPHWPYTPPEPFRTQYAKQPYYGEIAYMDQQLGRLVDAFQKKAGGAAAIIIAGDHGVGLGEHGEQQHGNLLYQSTVHVPLLVIGPGIVPATNDIPFSTRHIFDLILGFAHIDHHMSVQEVVMGEAMQPFLEYGWQPQVMAISSRMKTILAGTTEVYD